jgi:hypothetical protein
VSPFQAILDYELASGIPPGYVNATIQAHSPNGAWQKMERGEITLDDAFFTAFADELNNPVHWAAHCHKLASRTDGPSQAAFAKLKQVSGVDGRGQPVLPRIDARTMFWNMMRISRRPDPWMYPALQRLKESGRFVIAALSNTIPFPEGVRDETGALFVNELREGDKVVGDIRDSFDVFISSAHVGLRKPQKEIYDLAVFESGKVAASRGMGDVMMQDVVFLDDIGGNLKAAKALGMDTIKVNLGRTKEAVKKLEQTTRLTLIDESKL